MTANVLQLRNVGLFEAISYPPVTKVATKNELGENYCPPHVFLGAVICCLFFFYFYRFARIVGLSALLYFQLCQM